MKQENSSAFAEGDSTEATIKESENFQTFDHALVPSVFVALTRQ
jgi:hypothetical protein